MAQCSSLFSKKPAEIVDIEVNLDIVEEVKTKHLRKASRCCQKLGITLLVIFTTSLLYIAIMIYFPVVATRMRTIASSIFEETNSNSLTHSFWPMDSNYNDVYNRHNGVGINNPQFVSTGYNGNGAALSLVATRFQYLSIGNFKNMTYTSFTWELWAYPIELDNHDHVMVSMCESWEYRHCLQLMVRNRLVYFAFAGDDCVSSVVVSTNRWHHFAFVYDYSTYSQYIYLNGVLVCMHSKSGPFLGTSGSVTIGAMNSTGLLADRFWSGYLDDISYVSSAKTANEILSDATLVAHYSFDSGSLYDHGPNRINGTSVGLSFRVGRVNHAMVLDSAGDYFQATGFRLLGSNYRSYSISLWIYRSASTFGNGTIVHLSSLSNGQGWCLPVVGLTSTYQLISQNQNITGLATIVGPKIPKASWTHILTSYASTSGIHLWVNGSFIGSTGPFTYLPSETINTITLGNSLLGTTTCAHGDIAIGQFYGMLDEVKIYSRQLNSSEILELANP